MTRMISRQTTRGWRAGEAARRAVSPKKQASDLSTNSSGQVEESNPALLDPPFVPLKAAVAERFDSILFPGGVDRESSEQPNFFVDLNLDQAIATIIAGNDEYELRPFFYAAPVAQETIRFRQAVMTDVDGAAVRQLLKTFSEQMQTVRKCLMLSEKLYYQYQKDAIFLECIETYHDAVRSLNSDLETANLTSRGLCLLRQYVRTLAASEEFSAVYKEALRHKAALATVDYNILIRGDAVTVRKRHSETNYSADVTRTFEKFRQGEVKGYGFKFPDDISMDHIEGQILERVARLFPQIFQPLGNFCSAHREFVDPIIRRFDREIQFYITYLNHMDRLRSAHLQVCYPKVISQHSHIYAYETFDIALAQKLMGKDEGVVANDLELAGEERILVVTGPNQGGKTTFARTFGQIHYLAALGCPVPGREAQLLLHDRIFTHFEKSEDVRNLRGKLQDDLIRVHKILNEATSRSIIIMNEIFNSTTLSDALFLGKEILQEIIAIQSICVCVTFMDEFATLGPETVSMVSNVDQSDLTKRTFKVTRRPADGLAYAMAIAEKYRLTYQKLKERIKS